MSEVDGKKLEAVEIGIGSWRIEDSGVRCFLIEGSEKAMLVDTGFGTGNIKDFAEKLTSKPIFLVNTHIDGDHIGGNHLFSSVFMHPSEIKDYKTSKDDTELIPVNEGDAFDLGGREFEVLEAPGHTPGSIMLFDRNNKVLISGDSIGTAPVFMFGDRRNLDTYIKSLKKIESIKDGFDSIWPSHGDFPADTSLVQELIEGASKLRDGEVEGIKPPMDLPCNLYSYKRIKFLY